MRRGVISPEQLEKTRSDQLDRKTQFGQLLINEKIIEKSQLVKALSEQINEIFFEILTWQEGDFEFQEREVEESECIIDPINTSNLLLEGARRIDEWGRINDVIPSDKIVLKSTGKTSDKKLASVQEEILIFLKENRRPWEINQNINATEFEIYDALRKMMLDGLIERDERAEREEQSRREIVKSCLDRAGELWKNQGFHEAHQQLEKAIELDPENKKARKMITDIQQDIVREANRLFADRNIIPKPRQTISSIPADRLLFSSKEGFVFSRIDGHSTIKNLKYLTNLRMNDILIILHKFARMGLIYMEKKTSSNLQKSGKK